VVFYPSELPKSAWLKHYARHFDCVEINNTFYRLPSEEVFDRWRDAVPSGFRYALKYSRYASHMKKLKDPDEALGRFLARAERLEERLGPILVQLPPGWRRNLERLRTFLGVIPRAHRWAIELRDESWLHEDVFSELSARGAALVHHDLIEKHPWIETADFVYLRFHGDHYRGSYSAQALGAQARRLRACLERGLDAWVFFNNDEAAHAIGNALDLRRYLA
jgi:uncharacterized protein YecE (DUF72 family)